MICFIGNRPVLKIGRQQVAGYGTAWLRQSIERGAAAAEREDFPFIDDLIQGVQLYLEHKCPLQLLTIEELHAKVRRMLEKIGCDTIAQNLPLLAPPVTISLERVAHEVKKSKSPLAFFDQIKEEIQDLQTHGVEEIHFTHTQKSVQILQGTTEWSPSCEELHNEMLAFLKNLGHPHDSASPTTQNIRLNLI